MSVGAVAGLIAAGVFALLVLLLAVPIMKLGQVIGPPLAVQRLCDS
ncbi:hypothetical protein ARZXY2_4546 (plasmid) [Arthrobacter sp. ZXY-2]|nr:hypothetical protein ARZXY2_4546 [Arthrobacter sp. ZXY-2]